MTVLRQDCKNLTNTFIKSMNCDRENKLAKARKTRKSPGTLGLKKFGLGKLWVEKVWAQNIVINFLAELDHIKKINYCFFYFFYHSPPDQFQEILPTPEIEK